MLKAMLLAASATTALFTTSGVRAGVVRPAFSVKVEPQHRIAFPHRGSRLLYDQDDQDNPQAIVAQNFESAFDIYDCEAADDFKIPAGQTWKIGKIHLGGTHFSSAGPADSFSVTFYSSKKGKVGSAVKTCANAGYSYSDMAFGSVDVICKAKLRKGTYFLAVLANMNFSQGGEWGWITNNTVRGSPSMWRNPGGGFGVGCTDFETTTNCIPEGEGGDFAFALYGRKE